MEFPGTPTKIYQVSVQRIMWSKLAHAFALIHLDLIIHRTDILYILLLSQRVFFSHYFTVLTLSYPTTNHMQPTQNLKKDPSLCSRNITTIATSSVDHWLNGAIGMFNETNKLTHENIKSTVKKRHVKTVMFILTHLLCIFIL